MLRVLLSGAPEGLSPSDANQGLAFLAMLFTVTAVVSAGCVQCPGCAAAVRLCGVADTPRPWCPSLPARRACCAWRLGRPFALQTPRARRRLLPCCVMPFAGQRMTPCRRWLRSWSARRWSAQRTRCRCPSSRRRWRPCRRQRQAPKQAITPQSSRTSRTSRTFCIHHHSTVPPILVSCLPPPPSRPSHGAGGAAVAQWQLPVLRAFHPPSCISSPHTSINSAMREPSCFS